jgi:predicted amidohydrolase YtcJ
MDKQKLSPGRVSRRQFLRAAGLGLGTLFGSSLACGRSTQEAGPAALPTDTLQPTPVSTAPRPTVASVVTSPPPSPTAALTPELAADLVLTNGKVITVDAADTIARAVAVKDGHIQAVGSDEEIRALAGPATDAIDLAGRALTPGLIDAHNHLQVMGLMDGFYVSFLPPEVTTVEELKAALAEAVAEVPEGEWVQGYFLVVTEGRLPDKHDLDPASPRHPVWILQQGGHYGSANSLALQMANITAATPDPVGGVIARDSRGEPTGVFYNHRAMDVLRLKAPRPSMDMVRKNVVTAQSLFAACGVTSFQDNNVRGTDTVETYLDVGRQGDMRLRGSVYYTLEWPQDLDRALKEIDYGAGGELMGFAGFKFLLDGQLKMAYCHQPHNGERWDTPTWEPQNFKDAVRALHDTGLQICVHCAGDAAADLTLDAFEEAMEANPRSDSRHRIEHAIITTPEATRRMADLGVVVSTQPQFIRLGGDGYAPMFGEERARRVIVTREWLDGGVHLALGSDAPTTPWYTPQITLFGALARVTLSNERFYPEQALTIQEALRAHTMGSAYAAHEEEIKGSIEVGKLADLVVWGDDPYTVPNRELWKIPMDLTMVGGEIVYRRV